MVSCGDDVVSTPTTAIRSADPLNWWTKWNDPNSPAYVLTAELRDGKASHDLSPAELIYYCSIENKTNPVTLLCYLESESLLTEGQGYGDFEKRLYLATGYPEKWAGFYPQLVSFTYQLWLNKQEKMSFEKSYEAYPIKGKTYDNFKDTYNDYLAIMNKMANKNYAPPLGDGSGYYTDCQDLTISDIQKFLDYFPNTTLKRLGLFQEHQIKPSEIDYDTFKK